MDALGWAEIASCREQYVEDFYPENCVVLNAVKEICHGCPAKTPCLIASIPEMHGLWAGNTMSDRHRLRERAGVRIAPDDRDVARYRRAADEGWRTGDYPAALSKVVGAEVATRILEGNGDLPRRVA